MSNKVLANDVPRNLEQDGIYSPFVIDKSLYIADNMSQLEFDVERIGQIANLCGYVALKFWGYYGERTVERLNGYIIDDSLMPEWVDRRKHRVGMFNIYPNVALAQNGLSLEVLGMTMNTEVNFNAIPAEIQRLAKLHGIKPNAAFALLYGELLDESVKEMVRSQNGLIGLQAATEFHDDESLTTVQAKIGHRRRNFIERFIVRHEIGKIMADSPDGELVGLRPRD